ncbi:hypothetical protein, partial [Bartonella bovis]|uniref:hypothetical protein n=1 Tax=Bartonella bovis TaxID=155194 RepID=UPI001ABA6863
EAITGTLTIKGGEIGFKDGAGNYGVRVQNGATANLTSVTIKGAGSEGGSKGVWMESSGKMMMTNVRISDVDKAVLMNGAGTLNMEEVRISKVKMGVEATAGTLTIKGGEIGFKDGNGNYGVRVQNGVTATLTNVTIEGTGSGTSGSGEGSKGVWMESTGTMMMEKVTISNVAMGVEATNGTLTIKGGEIGFMGGAGNYGVRVGELVTMATITGTKIRGAGSGKGVIMGGKTLEMSGGAISNVAMGVEATNGDLTVSGVTMTGVQKGIDMSGSGTLTVNNNARITFTGEHGVKVESGVTSASLTNVTITGASGGTGTGVIMDGKTLEMTDVGISGVQTGIQVSNGNLTVSGGTMTGVQTGIDMSGSGKLVVNSGARIEFTGEHGVKVGNGVTATLTNVTIEGTGSGQGTGVVMGGTGEMTLTSVGISKVKVGVYATGGNLTISGGSISEVQTGITMSGSGTLMVNNGARITFKGEHGVRVGGTVNATITGAEIKGGGATGTGVIKEGEGDLRMDNVGISGVQTGIQVTSGNLTVIGGTMTDVGMGISMSGSGTLMVNSGARITVK